MIEHRYISIPIYFIISSSIIYPAHLAMGKEQSRFSENREGSIRIENASKRNLPPQHIIAQKADSDSSVQINKQWSKIGIVVTSVLFLFMVYVLFKEKRTAESKTEQEMSVLDGNNNKEQNISNSSAVALDADKPPKSVEQASFFTIGMDLEEELNDEFQVNKEPIEAKQFEGIESEMTITEVPEDLAGDGNPIIDSDIMGKLTIMTSNTTETEIDVVFELIQDLHQSDRLEDTNASKDLKRKAIWELGQSNDFRAVEPLIQTIPKADSLEKGLILDAITQITNRSFASINRAVLTSLEDENAEVRKNAIQDLTSLYQSMSSIALRLSKMVDDRNLEVRQTAKWTLEKFDRMSSSVTSIDSKIGVKSNIIADRNNDKSHHSF